LVSGIAPCQLVGAAGTVKLPRERKEETVEAADSRYNVDMVDADDPLSDTLGLPLMRPEPGKKQTLMGWVRTRFLTGLLVAFPLVVTIFFARFLFNLLDRWSYPITARMFGFSVPGVGAALALILIFLLGLVAHNVLGRRVLRFGEKQIGKVPVLRSIYLGTREVTRAFGSNRTRSFRRVVLIPYPLEGSWCLAFVTGEFDVGPRERPQRMVSVFMPSTPNPTTGFYLIYPVEDVLPTDLTIEEAARMVISGGILAPPPDRIMRHAPAPRGRRP
jgi:uncharacterized membrane protein